MFYKYEIKNNGIEDILYLYLTMTYEFSRELALDSSDKELARRTRNFINNNNINYNGKKVYLVIDGIVVKSLDIMNYDKPIEILKDSLYYSNDHFLVTIRMFDNSLIELPLKEYLLGVLAANSFPDLDIEVLKTLSILYRTYAFKCMSEKREITAYNDFAIYKPISYYKLVWTIDYETILNKLVEAINDTDCLFLSYNNNYILPFIHFSNTGCTYTHSDYSYLSSVSSLWDLASPYYVEIKDFSYDVISSILNIDISSKTNVSIIDIDKKKFIKRISFDDSVFSGEELKNLLNLKSLNINIIFNKNGIRIITKGYGNGLGLSIFGANELAKNGCDYANIIHYYFPNIKINKYIKELS